MRTSYYPIGYITLLARPSVRLSVCPSVHYRLETKKRRKIKLA